MKTDIYTFADSGFLHPANRNFGGDPRFKKAFTNSSPIPRLAPVISTDFGASIVDYSGSRFEVVANI